MSYLPKINHPSEDDARTAHLRRGVKKIQEMLRPSTTYWRMKVIRADAYATARIIAQDLDLEHSTEGIEDWAWFQGTPAFLALVLDEIGVKHSGARA